MSLLQGWSGFSRLLALLLAGPLIVLAVGTSAKADISSDGRLVLGSEISRLEHVTIWNLTSGRVVRVLRSRDSVEPAFSRDGRLVVAAGKNKTAQILDVASGRILRTLRGVGPWLMKPTFSPDGARVVARDGEPLESQDATVGVWSTATGRRLRTFRCGDGHCSSAECSPDGRQILAAGINLTARLWDLHTGRLLRVFGPGVGPDGNDQPTDALLSPDGRLVVVVVDKWTANGKTVWVYDTATGHIRFVIHRAVTPSFSPDGKLLATDQGKTGLSLQAPAVRIYDARSGRLLQVLRDPTGAAGSPFFSSDGSRLITYADLHGGDYRALRIWDVARGRIKHTIHERFAEAKLSPDGRMVVTIGSRLRVWNAATGQLLHTLRS